MSIGKNIYTLRTGRDMTQKELAELMEVSRQAVSNWELGTALPSSEKLIKLSEVFGVTMDALLGEDRAEETSTEPSAEGPRQRGRRVPPAAGILTVCAVLAVILFFGGFGKQEAETGVIRKYDPGFSDITLITEENAEFIGKAGRGRTSISDPMPANRIITERENDAVVVPFSIVEAETKKGVTPALIGGNGTMCIFTRRDGDGWALEEGDVLSWSFEKYDRNDNLGVGYIRDGVMYDYTYFDGKAEDVYQVSAGVAGEYYIYYICLSSDPIAIKEGKIRVN